MSTRFWKAPTTGIAGRERGSVMFEFARSSMPSNERPGWPTGERIRCGEPPGVDELGDCGHCHRAVRGGGRSRAPRAGRLRARLGTLHGLVRAAGPTDRVSLHGATLV